MQIAAVASFLAMTGRSPLCARDDGGSEL